MALALLSGSTACERIGRLLCLAQLEGVGRGASVRWLLTCLALTLCKWVKSGERVCCSERACAGVWWLTLLSGDCAGVRWLPLLERIGACVGLRCSLSIRVCLTLAWPWSQRIGIGAPWRWLLLGLGRSIVIVVAIAEIRVNENDLLIEHHSTYPLMRSAKLQSAFCAAGEATAFSTGAASVIALKTCEFTYP